MRKILLVVMIMVLCLAATGCMGGQKDITKDEAASYEAMVAEACEACGYEYEEQTVLPKGSALYYALSGGDGSVEIGVTINEESTYDKVACEFGITRYIKNADETSAGLDQHLDVLVMIAENFTDEITKDAVADYMNDDSLWKEGQTEDEPFMYKDMTGNLQHIITEKDGEYEEYFYFGWDNGKTYKLRNDK